MSRVRDFLVGLDYDAIDDEHGHFCVHRKVTMQELVSELQGFIEHGQHYPQFPASARPTITYCWDFSNNDYGDVYHEVLAELEKNKQEQEWIKSLS